MGFLDLGWHILAAGSQFCTVISQCPAVVDCLFFIFCGRTAQTLLYNCTCIIVCLLIYVYKSWSDFVCVRFWVVCVCSAP